MLERHCWGTGLLFGSGVLWWFLALAVKILGHPVVCSSCAASAHTPSSSSESQSWLSTIFLWTSRHRYRGPQPSHHSASELALGALIAFVHVLADLAACTDVGCFLFACGPAQSSKLCHPLYCSRTFSSKDRIPAVGGGSSSQVLFPGVLSLRLEVFFRILFTVTLLL